MKFSDFVEKKLILEMAIKGDSLRGAIKLDSDDIQFLQQFRPQLWIQAIEQRYSEDLYEALKARETTRKKRSKVIIELLIPKLISGKFDSGSRREFEEVFGSESLKSATEEIRTHYGKKWRESHKDNLGDAAKNAAEDIAYYAVELEVPDVKEPEGGYKEYKFGKLGSKTTTAKPFINRLVHKLEKTQGKDHDHVATGLRHDEHPHGMYGFDLANPQPKNKKIPHSTDGMQLITHDMAVKAIKTLLGHNYHRYYGDMPNVGEEVEGKKIEGWKPIKLGDHDLADNTFYDEKKESIVKLLGLPASHKDMIEMEYEKTIEGIRIFKNKDERKIKYQGTDGKVFENNISTKKENAGFTKKLIQALITKIHTDEKGPPIPGKYPEGIPRSEKQIVHLPHFKTQIIENGKPVDVDMPHVLPAKYYRKARQDDPEDKKNGYNKDIVHLSHDEYVKGKVGHFSGASFHPGQNRRSEEPLLYGVKGHSDALDSIFGSMRKDDQGNYIDIIKGIDSALLKPNESRRITQEKITILKNIKNELHDVIVERMTGDLRNKKLQTFAGRVNFAKNNTMVILQQDIHGLGTRRLPTGKGMDSFSELPKTLLTQDQKELLRRLAAGELNRQLGERGRRFASGQHAQIYGRKSIKSLVADIRKEIDEMEKLDPVKSAEHGTIYKKIDDLYRNQSKRKDEFFERIRELLHLIVGDKEQIYDPAKRETEVEEIIDRIKTKKTIGAMWAELQKFTVVQYYLRADGHSRQPIRPSGDPLQRKTQSNMPLGQSAEDKGLAAQKDWKSLSARGEYLALAFNSTFRNKAEMETLQGLKVWIDKNRVGMGINPDEYEEAMDNLDYAIAKKIAERALKNKT